MRIAPDQIRYLPPFIRQQIEAKLGPQNDDSAPAHVPADLRPRKPAKGPRIAQDRGAASSAQPEQAVRPPPLEPPQGETLYAGRVSVRIVSYRRRLLDPDNLCAKWFLDACRYSRLISDDRPQDITYEVSQIKVRQKAEERTEVTLTPLP